METNIDYWKKAQLIASGIDTKEAELEASSIRIQSSNHCPRCRSEMLPVSLVTIKRKGLFCAKDNVVIPLPIET